MSTRTSKRVFTPIYWNSVHIFRLQGVPVAYVNHLLQQKLYQKHHHQRDVRRQHRPHPLGQIVDEAFEDDTSHKEHHRSDKERAKKAHRNALNPSGVDKQTREAKLRHREKTRPYADADDDAAAS